MQKPFLKTLSSSTVSTRAKGRQSILKITSKFKKLGKTASPDFMFVTAQVSKKKVLGVI
jgi:hypothetical protein